MCRKQVDTTDRKDIRGPTIFFALEKKAYPLATKGKISIAKGLYLIRL